MAASRALSGLKSSLGVVEALLALEGTYVDPPLPADSPVVQGLRGGAAIFTVAAYEVFLTEVVQERVRELRKESPTFDKLPSKLRVAAVFGSLKIAMKGKKFGEPSTEEGRLPTVHAAASLIASGTINPDSFGLDGDNPNSKATKVLFESVGLSDVFASIVVDFVARWGKQEASTFIADKLDEIVVRRHVVAHTISALNISRTQLLEARLFIDVLGESLDIALQKHVTSLATYCR